MVSKPVVGRLGITSTDNEQDQLILNANLFKLSYLHVPRWSTRGFNCVFHSLRRNAMDLGIVPVSVHLIFKVLMAQFALCRLVILML